MRVLNVNMSIDTVTGGGTAERTLQISRSLVRAGFQCDVLTINSNLDDERIEQLNGANFKTSPFVRYLRQAQMVLI